MPKEKREGGDVKGYALKMSWYPATAILTTSNNDSDTILGPRTRPEERQPYSASARHEMFPNLRLTNILSLVGLAPTRRGAISGERERETPAQQAQRIAVDYQRN